jgi:heat shock protein HtpX
MSRPQVPASGRRYITTPIAARSSARRRWRSQAQIVALLAAMGGLLAYCGWIVAGWHGIAWSILAGALSLAAVRRVPPEMFLAAMRAERLLPEEAPELQAHFAALCRRAGLSPMPALYRLDEALPLAFSLGAGDRAAVVVADSLLAGLTRRELAGIVAHEIIHLRNGDIALQQIGLVLGWLARLLSQFGMILIFIGLVMRIFSLAEFPLLELLVLAVAPIGVGLMRLALSRAREAEADLGAADLTGDPAGLAAALVKLRQWQERLLRQLVPTAHPLHLPSLFDDHPPTEQRIRRLLGLPQRAASDAVADGRFYE